MRNNPVDFQIGLTVFKGHWVCFFERSLGKISDESLIDPQCWDANAAPEVNKKTTQPPISLENLFQHAKITTPKLFEVVAKRNYNKLYYFFSHWAVTSHFDVCDEFICHFQFWFVTSGTIGSQEIPYGVFRWVLFK